MKRASLPVALFMLIVLNACATLGVPQPKTFNERLAASYLTLTAARDTTFTLITARTLSKEDGRNVEQQLDTVRTGLDLAREVHATNPPAGDAKLDAMITALDALQTYLQSRSKGT